MHIHILQIFQLNPFKNINKVLKINQLINAFGSIYRAGNEFNEYLFMYLLFIL